MTQEVIVFIILAAVVSYIVFNYVRKLRTKKTSACDGCNGCDLKKEIKKSCEIVT